MLLLGGGRGEWEEVGVVDRSFANTFSVRNGNVYVMDILFRTSFGGGRHNLSQIVFRAWVRSILG